MLDDTGRHPCPPCSSSPPITALMQHHRVPGLNTIRQAQQLLVDGRLVEIPQGMGFFAFPAEPPSWRVDRPRRAAGGARREQPRGLHR